MRRVSRPLSPATVAMRCVAVLLLTLGLAACGGGGGGDATEETGGGAGEGAGGGAVQLAVTPQQQTVDIGTSVQLSASAEADWSVVEPGGGTVDTSGRYTAPLVPGTYHVRATAKADPSVTDEAEITVRVGEQWLAYLNLFRSGTRAPASRRAARAGTFLPAVAEDADLSVGALKHAKYLVANDTSHPEIDPDGNVHDEEPTKPGYSAEGQTAAQKGNVVKSEDAAMDSARAFDAWMTGPFHALGILDPRLERVGYGIWNEADGTGWQSAAVLNVLSGLADQVPDGVSFPLFFPGPDAVVHLLEYPGLESPDPLSGCDGFTAPTGLPLVVQLGSDPFGTNVPDVTAVSLQAGGGTDLEVCWFDEATYTNPDPDDQDRGRLVLNTRDAVVIVPRAPLEPGQTYTASVTADGTTYSWSFRTWPPVTGDFALVPAPGTVLPGQAVSFQLVDAGGSPATDARWFVNGEEGGGADAGTIDPAGTYTAPSDPSAPVVVTVRAESATAPSAAAETTFTVASVGITLNPTTAVLDPGGTTVFTAAVAVNPEGALSDTAVEFLVEGILGGNATVGTVSDSGQYAAPASPPPAGQVAVTARLKALPQVAASATVTFRQQQAGGSGGGTTLSLAPAVSQVALGETVGFVLFSGADPVTDPVRWLVNGVEGGDATYGSIASDGTYTAPAGAPPGAVTVRAELESDPTRFAEVTFTVSAPTTVSIAPAEATVPLDGRETFTVTTEPAGQAVIVLVNGVEGGDTQVGTIEESADAPGTYTYHAPILMPTAGNQVTLEARLAGDPTASASAAVTLVAEPADIQVAIDPQPPRVGLGATVTFTATVTGAVNTNVRWFVNNVEGGDPATGTITDAGEYKAPPLMPTKPLTITIRAQSVEDPTAFDEVSFPLMELVADPGIVRSTQAGSSHAISLTAELSDGTSVDLTNDPGIQASTDNTAVATASVAPPTVTMGSELGRTTVTFTDTTTPGSPQAGVIVVSDTDYVLEVTPDAVYGAVEGYQKPIQVLLEPQRGPHAGGAYDLAPTDAVTYEALDSNGWVQPRESPVDPLPDPTTYVAYVDAAAGRVVFGRKVGVAAFRVTESQTGKSATFTAEFLGLEVTPWIVKADGVEGAATNAGDVVVTPEGTQGFNETVALALFLKATDSQGQTLLPDELAALLGDVRGNFRVAADQGGFLPPGLEALWHNTAGGFGGSITVADPPIVYEDGTDRVAEVEVRTETVTVSGLVPAPQIGGILDLPGQNPDLQGTVHVLADVVPRAVGDVTVTLDLTGTVLLYRGQRIATPVQFTVTGAFPEPDTVNVGPTNIGPTGSPFYVNVSYAPAVVGLTPVVEYRPQGGGGGWTPAPLLTGTFPGSGIGGGSGLTSQGTDGFVAAFDSSQAGTYEFRIRYLEFPDDTGYAVQSTEVVTGSASTWAERTVQDFSEGALQPVRVCTSADNGVEVDFSSRSFTLYRPDGSQQSNALTFTVLSGGTNTTSSTTEVAKGGCAELQPQLAVAAEPGDVIAGSFFYTELPNQAAGTIELVFGGASLVATPAVQLAPSGHSGAFQATWRLKGGKSFADLLAAGTPTLARVELRRDGQAALEPLVDAVTPVDASTLDVTLTVPEEYFTSGRGSFELHLFFGSQGEAHYKAGPLDIAEVKPTGAVPTVLPLNAKWPGVAERARVPVEVEVTGTTLPVRVTARVETAGQTTPLAGFSRTRTRTPGVYVPTYTLQPKLQRWLAGGQTARFDLYGDLTDQTTTVGDQTVDLPDGLPDRVSSNPGDTTLAVEVTQQGLAQTILEQTLTVFNFVPRHETLRAPTLAVEEGNLSRDDAYAALSFEPNQTTGEPTPPDPNAAQEVWIGIDHDPEKGLGVLDMPFFPGTPDDGRWADFVGEPEPFAPDPVTETIVTGSTRLTPFGLTLGGVCFDPWTYGRKSPNGTELLSFFPAPPDTMLDSGLLYQQGGASGGRFAGTRYQVITRTPGVDTPGLDCGYLRTGQISDLGDTIGEEAVRADSAADGRVVTFSKDLDGRDVIRTAFHLGGPNAAFEFTTDPTDPSGQPLVEATLKAPLVLSRYPQVVRDDDIRLTTRVDAEAALKASTAKVVVSVGAAAVGAMLTAAGPAGVLASAGVAAAFQIWDNQAMNPSTGKGLPDHALASLVSTAQGAPPGILAQEGLEEVFPRVWERLTVNAVLDQDTGKFLLYETGTFERVPVKKPFGVFTQAPESLRFEVSGAQLTAGLIAGVLANVINDSIAPENYSANHTSHAYALDQVALVIPENAVQGDPQAGARVAWLARLTQSDLDLRTARILARASARASRKGGGATVQVAGQDRSAPFYLRMRPAFGPLVIVAVPGGQTQAAPSDLSTKYPEVDPAQRNLVDFRVRVGGSDPTAFPFLTTTVVEAGRTSPQATARVFVDQSESELELRMIDPVLESISDGTSTWISP
ncbi:CAP domain-containing protein [Deferrisoma camini]|uniref:CAP domain-containing protein n=1 Tax=Deferrisoma camini TaxID=1035120 RepID=UPI0004B72BAD|nr:CAP domain-containing protein [Deferrisoma camini]